MGAERWADGAASGSAPSSPSTPRPFDSSSSATRSSGVVVLNLSSIQLLISDRTSHNDHARDHLLAFRGVRGLHVHWLSTAPGRDGQASASRDDQSRPLARHAGLGGAGGARKK